MAPAGSSEYGRSAGRRSASGGVPSALEEALGGDRPPICGATAPVGVLLAKGIGPLHRQLLRPFSNTAERSRERLIGVSRSRAA